jgi:L-fucose isomerase
MAESILNSSFDWNGFRAAKIVATENDSKNAIGMLIAQLLSGMPQLFADIRTNWTPQSIKKATGVDVTKIAKNGLIDKRNSGSGSLDYALDVIKLAKGGRKTIQEVAEILRSSKKLQKELMDKAIKGTTYTGADLIYFPGDGLSSNYRTPGNIPMTSYRYNVVGDQLTCSVVEGKTVQLPKKVADHISACTNESWPETYWVPRDMSSYEYMSRIGPNHDANSFGLIGADMITLNAMLRIPVDMHNIPEKDIFRPTMWDRFGGDDFRACAALGPLYT